MPAGGLPYPEETKIDATASSPPPSAGFSSRVQQELDQSLSNLSRFADSPDRDMLERYIGGQSPTGNPLADGGFAIMLAQMADRAGTTMLQAAQDHLARLSSATDQAQGQVDSAKQMTQPRTSNAILPEIGPSEVSESATENVGLEQVLQKLLRK